MPDYGTRYTDRTEKVLEVRLQRIFTEAQSDILKKLEDFTAKYQKKDKLMRKKLEDGEITQEKYDEWVSGQVFQGAQWEQKVKDIDDTLLQYYSQALDKTYDKQLDVFSSNANYQAYCMEHDIGKSFSFDIYDVTTVERLVKETPELLPRKIVNKKKHNTWNQGIINNCITQGIIQGESIHKIARRIANTTANHNMKSATMYARTAMTSAQNGGRMQMLNEAKDMGINVKKQWLATSDGRTRDSHRHLDGQIRDVDKPFKSDFGRIDYPGDPKAHPADVYNCRCTLVYVYPEHDDMSQYPNWEEAKKMTYPEWKDNKETEKQIGSASGIIQKASRYNDKVHDIDVKVSELDVEYKQLYTDSILKFNTEEYNDIVKQMAQIEEEIAKLREKSVLIQAYRSKYLSEDGEKEITKAFGKIKGKHNAAVDAKSVNVITGDQMTQTNCGSCVLAFDARRRGINCQAIKSYGTNNGQVETWWKGAKFKSTSSYWGTDAKEEIRITANQWGEGARGIIQVDWSVTTGHYFAFEVVNGECTFIDPQTGQMQADDLFTTAKPGTVKYMRTDDKVLTKSALFGMEGKEEQ